MKTTLLTLFGAAVLFLCGVPAHAAIEVKVQGPAGQVTRSLPNEGGAFDVNLPLTRNAQNRITVTARNADGDELSQTINLTQLSLDQIVVAEVTTERLPPERIEQLVNEGVIDLADPENFNVSTFNIVLTIGGQRVPIATQIVTPIQEELGFETIRPKFDPGSGGGSSISDSEVVVFELTPPGPPGLPQPRIYGVIVMEGRIKTLKEFFSVRLLLMNTSGIFTLKDVSAQLFFPDGGLSHTLPSDGIISFGDILPGDGDQPGQKEREFIIRGDDIGVRGVQIDFGGTVAGPGLPEEDPIAFNGTASSSVEVKGPPKFLVTVVHPPVVVTNEPYNLIVEIQNMGELPALYTSFELEVGADALIENCLPDSTGTNIVCEFGNGPVIRTFGHILPGEKVRETYRLFPLKSGPITSCLGISDQNIQLQVAVGNIGCLVGQYPPILGEAGDQPTVSVLPLPNQQGVSPSASVTAFFSELMDERSFTTGEGGSFNVLDPNGDIVNGGIRFIELGGRTIAIWQRDAGFNILDENTRYTVVLTEALRDLDGHALFNPWQSEFRTTSLFDDQDPPELTLTILPPVVPNFVLPGQLVVVNAYAADQGSGIARVELRIRDLDSTNTTYRLIDQKTVFNPFETLEPSKFTIDTATLTPGNAYQLLGTAYDVAGNVRDSTISIVLAATADPPTIQLPPDPTNFILRGVSVPLTPRAITGAVRQVQYQLNGNTNAFATVFLAPWQTQVRTLDLALGVHTVKAVAVDALLQTGEDEFVFEIVENLNEPVVGFTGTPSGSFFLTGSVFTVNGFAEDPVGIRSVQYFFNSVTSPPIASGSAPLQIQTALLPTGTYSILLLATNNLGIANNPLSPDATFEFTIVSSIPGPPPPSPVVTSVSEPDQGTTLILGTTLPGAAITIVNTNQGFVQIINATTSGLFTASIDADGGDGLRLTAFHPPTSPSNSAPTLVTVPAPIAVTNLIITPATRTFTATGQFQDFVVTAQLAGGGTSNVTPRATFSSSKPSVASVNGAGRAVAQAFGNATITATFRTNTAQALIEVDVITLTNFTVTVSKPLLTFPGDTAQITVIGLYNNGTSAPLASGIAYGSSDSSIATVNSAGIVTAVSDGSTTISVAAGGLPPKQVAVGVAFGLNPPPVTHILSPVDGTQVERGQFVTVSVQSVDPTGGVVRTEFRTTGAFTSSNSASYAVRDVDTRNFSFTVPVDTAINSPIHIAAWSIDIGGLVSPTATVSLTVADLTAPAVAILSPTNGTSFNELDTVALEVAVSDAVGVSQVRFETEGAFVLSGVSNLVPPVTAATVPFSFVLPPDAPSSNMIVRAVASDLAGNTRTSTPVTLIMTDADITPPSTIITSALPDSSNAIVVLNYTVTDGMDDLDYVEIFWRRNGIGTFNKYIDADSTNFLGRFFPQSGTNGTVTFDTTKLGGDGDYEFYSVGFDLVGNRESAPTNGFDRATNIVAGTVWTDITNSITIGDGDTSFDNQNLRISNAVVTIEGAHTFHNMDLLGTGMITHAATTLTNEPGFNVTLWSLHVASNASLNVNHLGYLGGLRNGNGDEGRTTNNAAGSTVRSGGSHGGLGGIVQGVPNALHGNLTQPTDLGSGGSSSGFGNAGGNGGGRIQLNTLHIAADGALMANGQSGAGNVAGSGAGGSIYILTRTLSGQGVIRANGGAFQAGGGGGRVAVHYTDISTKDTTLIQAFGGQGSSVDGGNGTVFLKGLNEGDGTLIIDGQGASSPFSGLPIPQGVTFDNIIIRNDARVIVDDPIIVNDSLQILTGSILTHSVNQTNGLRIEAKSVLVDDTSSIDVIGKGYRGGLRDGNASNQGETLHGQLGAVTRAGGSYGGLGGIVNGAGSNLVYGVPHEPSYLGAGGSSSGFGDAGGNGGGRVTIHASDSVTIHGEIRAGGQSGSGNAAGSGAGGSVLIETSLFQGSGVVSADGGANQTGGGGGRVAVYYNFIGTGTNNFNDLRNLSAFGGKGSTVHGSAGTVFPKQLSQQHGDLYVDEGLNSGTSARWSPLTPVGFGTVVSVSSNVLVTDGGVPHLPGGLAGVILQPNLNDPTLFTIVDNTTTTIVVEVVGGTNLTDVATIGDRYAALYRYDNVTFRRGAYLVIGDRLQVNGTLNIQENGVLSHFDSTLGFEPGLDLTIGTLSISSNSTITVDGRGYLGGLRGGAGNSGQTLGNVAGSPTRSGGSHGGLGGYYDGPGPSETYGDLTQPEDLGSGGSSSGFGHAGGDGGGRINISANNLVINGLITASGLNGAGSAAGSGSGGSVLIQAQSVSGTGTVRANGGNFQVGGGGGRVAVHYTALTMDQNQFQALGGQGLFANGGNGTLYFKSAMQTHGDFVIDGGSFATPVDSAVIPFGFTFDNLIVRNGAQAVATAPINVNQSLQVLAGSTLRHPRGQEAGLVINGATVLIDGTSLIDVTGRGYRGGLRDGNASNQGETLHGQLGAVTRSGGSYGGLGGITDGAGNNLVYGAPQAPIYLGAGGSSSGFSDAGGNGGGRVTIHATDSVTVHGEIRANGQSVSGNAVGSGAGGSVLIQTGLFQGSGAISANGGAGQTSGGGGRIAVYYNFFGTGTNSFNDLRNLSAFGGKGSSAHGSAGTVFMKQLSQQHGDLYVDEGLNSGTSVRWSPLTPVGFGTVVSVGTNLLVTDSGVAHLPGGLAGVTLQPNLNEPTLFTILDNTTTTIVVDVSGGTNLTDVANIGDRYAAFYRFDNVTFRRGAYLVLGDRLQVDGTLNIQESGALSHFDATMGFEPRLDLTVGTLTLSTNSTINVDGRGYLGGLRGGAGTSGQTLGNVAGSPIRSGGSHGGLGGRFDGPGPSATYGDLTQPEDLGSGGSSSGFGDTGGDGGGRIKISANNLVIDGLITANGINGSVNIAGSGSGGSVLIQAQSVSGVGSVQANGGGLQNGGGGGRVAVHYTALTMNQNQFQALGGQGSFADGGNGTLFFKSAAQNLGDLVVDGNNVSTPNDTTPLPDGMMYDNLYLINEARVMATSAIIVSNTMEITGGSILMHPLSLETGVTIRAANLLIGSNSMIDVSSRGYRGGLRDGNPNNSGFTTNETLGSSTRSGGSFGGLGGVLGGVPNSIYGDETNPVELGSGGSSSGFGNAGGNGGGRVDIWVPGTMTLHGTIRADGGTGAGNVAGSGSGGSVLVRAGQLEGDGTITAHGGGFQLGGGGGRIAVYFHSLNYETNNATALGGVGSTSSGSPGTVYFQQVSGGPGPFGMAPPSGGWPAAAMAAQARPGEIVIFWAMDGEEGYVVQFSPHLIPSAWTTIHHLVHPVWTGSVSEPSQGFWRLIREP